jgi:hypothetical protein
MTTSLIVHADAGPVAEARRCREHVRHARRRAVNDFRVVLTEFGGARRIVSSEAPEDAPAGFKLAPDLGRCRRD